MDVKEMLTRFVDNGISLRRIADAANINKNTISALYKGENVSPQTVDKVRVAMKDIALKLYNIAYSDEISSNEEWEE